MQRLALFVLELEQVFQFAMILLKRLKIGAKVIVLFVQSLFLMHLKAFFM
jgi:hypothetical protein